MTNENFCKSNIAVLVLVHRNQEQARRFIDHLSTDFDIFVHIDRRSKISIPKSKNVFVYKKYKSYHGSFNLTLASLFLLEKAFKIGYNRYILISAQDLPLVTNSQIAEFFSNNTREFLILKKIPDAEGWPPIDRLTSYHPNNFIRERSDFLTICFFRCQRKILHFWGKLKQRTLDYDFYAGSQWTNYTHSCVEKIFDYLKKDKKYINRFKWTHCSDEIFFQTIISQLSGLEIVNDNLRYVDWHTGPESPRILRSEDYDRMIASTALFARKFDPDVDAEIIEKIYAKIGEK